MNSTGNNTCGVPRSALEWYLSPYNVSMFVIYVLVIASALIANILVCIAVGINPKLRQSTATYFIISLAVSDLATAFFSMPFDLESFTTFGRWYHNGFLCNVWTTAYLITIPTSMWNLFILSIDRYRTLRNPWARFRDTPFMTQKRAIITLTLLWILSTIYALAPQMGWKYIESSLIIGCSGNRCIFNITPMYSVLSSVCNFYVPMFAMCFIYYKIYQIARTQYVRPVPVVDLQSVASNSPVMNKKDIKHTKLQILKSENTKRENNTSEAESCSFEMAVEVEENKLRRQRIGGLLRSEQGLLQQKYLLGICSHENIVAAEIQNDTITSSRKTCLQERLTEDKTHEKHDNTNESICCCDIDKITESEKNLEGSTRLDDKESKHENEPTKIEDVDMKKEKDKVHEVEEHRSEQINDDSVEEKEVKNEGKCAEEQVKEGTLRERRFGGVDVSSRTSLTDESNNEECSDDVTELPKESQSRGTSDKKTDVLLSMIEITADSTCSGRHEQNVIVGKTDLNDDNVNNENKCAYRTLVKGRHSHQLLQDEGKSDATLPLTVQNETAGITTLPPSLGPGEIVAIADTETNIHSNGTTSDERQDNLRRKTQNNQEKTKSTSSNSLESTSTYQSTVPYNIYRIDYLSSSRETLSNLTSNVDFMTKRKKIFVKNKKAACTVSMIVSTFLICWFPRTTLSIVQNLCIGKCFTSLQAMQVMLYARHATLLLGYLSAAINPIVYSYRNRQFRRAYREMARKLLPCLKSLFPRLG